MRTVKHLMCAFLLAGAVLTSFASDYAHHTLIRILPQTKEQEEALLGMGLDLIPGERRGDHWAAALPSDLDVLRRNGYSYEVLIMDMEEFYQRRAAREGHLDDMGGYKTYLEIETALDQIHSDHPTITGAKFSIGETIQGNEVWCMKISDNPEVDEDEIELLFTSLTHAREPAAMELLFVFFDYLTENYSPGSGNEATALVENREFYWIPCVNPDGYLYNEQQEPDGGGMWRKNRRNNGDGSYGVDLNRNFGFNWGWDDEGSSPWTGDDTYRGTAGFSEAETDAYRDFVESREFIIAMNYHTYQNLVLYPWGVDSYQGGYTIENEIFEMMADSMAYYIEEVNGANYGTGTSWETLYTVNGDANDWCYGEQTTKGRIFAFTTEVGGITDGFWPAPTRIMPLALENLPSNLFVSRYAEQLIPPDQLLQLISATFSEAVGDGDDLIESGEIVNLEAIVRNAGGLDLTVLTGTLASLSPLAEVTNAIVSWNDLAPGASEAGLAQFTMEIAPGVPEPFGIDFTLHFVALSGIDTTLNLSLIVGPPVMEEDFESGATGWTHEAGAGHVDQWHLSTENSHSTVTAYKCGSTGTGAHASNLDARLTTPLIVDLPEQAELTFWSNIEAERSGTFTDSAYDGGVVEISIDSGEFEGLDLNEGYTHTFRYTVGGGSPYLGPMPGRPCLSGTADWTNYSVNLSPYAGADIQIRFRYASDGSVNREGWYIDDVSVTGVRPVLIVTPTGLTIEAEGSDLILRWNDDINPAYVIISGLTPDGPFDTYVGSTTEHELTIINGLAGEKMFFVVKGVLVAQ